MEAAGIFAIAPGNWGVRKIRGLFEATSFGGLRKAGMSEE
jgi:hypothetical protein